MNPLPAQGQYKRIHQTLLKQILDRKLDNARSGIQKQLAARPQDGETYFVQTVLETAEDNTAAALNALGKALEAGLPPGRFVAGPRPLLAPIADTEMFQQLTKSLQHRPLHGPMLGHVTHDQARVWLRTATATDVTVTAKAKGREPVHARAKTSAASDFTTSIEIPGLAADTDYTYSVKIGAGSPIPGGTFRTLPGRRFRCKCRVAFGGGAGYIPEHERMWDTIRSFHPQALLLLGDNVYIDAPKRRALQRYCYYRRQSRPEFRKLVASTAVYSVWDDHDFGTDDCFGGPDRKKPAWKPRVHEVFQQNWTNPPRDNPIPPGCYYDFFIGNIHFVMLDSRYYREDPKTKKPSMLGGIQKSWLLARLLVPSAFKVLCSPVPWAEGTKGASLDTWDGYSEERAEIFAFLGKHKIEGVVLLSADRHRTDVWQIPRGANHYPFTEFNSSRLTNQHFHKKMKAAEFSYNEKQSFGLLDFDTTAEDPSLTFQAINIDGDVVYKKVLRFSELTY